MKHSHCAAMNRLLENDNDERLFAWQELGAKLMKLEKQIKTQSALAFSFVEGSIVRALKEGIFFMIETVYKGRE